MNIHRWTCVGLCALLISLLGCESDDVPVDNPIVIGAVLPFSGEHAAVGLNIEQAVEMAIDDVNRAGGVNGRQLMLISRDSNEGSDKGYEQVKELLYEKKVKYLIGPEENALAKRLVKDVKSLDVVNLLPGFAAPIVHETGKKGAWIRLAPTPQNMGCAMSISAINQGYSRAVTLVSTDDYLSLMASAFNTYFKDFGGVSIGSLTINPGEGSYRKYLETIDDQDADIAILMAYPPTAAKITQEWVGRGQKGNWYLAPTLHTDVFLQNIPMGALNDVQVFSPSNSIGDECEAGKGSNLGAMFCTKENFEQFSLHYSEAWQQDTPLLASPYYYDAVVLLAFGLQLAKKDGEGEPSPSQLKEYIRQVAEEPGDTVRWSSIKKGLDLLKKGEDVAYEGAAANYTFNLQGDVNYGETTHQVIDTWVVRNTSFVTYDSIGLVCRETNLY